MVSLSSITALAMKRKGRVLDSPRVRERKRIRVGRRSGYKESLTMEQKIRKESWRKRCLPLSAVESN